MRWDWIKYWERRKGCTGGNIASAPAPSYGGGGGYAQVVGTRPNSYLAVRSGPGTSYPLFSSLYLGDSGILVLRCWGAGAVSVTAIWLDGFIRDI